MKETLYVEIFTLFILCIIMIAISSSNDNKDEHTQNVFIDKNDWTDEDYEDFMMLLLDEEEEEDYYS